MNAPLETAIEQLWPLDQWRSARVLVAVSGGADSVALLRALVALTDNPQQLLVAHFNHGWRGAASDGDERFVSELGDELGVEVQVGRALVAAEATATAATDLDPARVRKSEERARDARYQFLIEAAYRFGARYVCTAHTASDRVETLLHNLFRGTGLAGVCTPRFSRPLHDELLLVRPLLGTYRDEVLDYLSGLGQSYRTDASNQDQSYKRNWIRQSLLPLIRETYGDQVDQRLAHFSTLAEETVAWQRTAAHSYLEQVEGLLAEALRTGNLQVELSQIESPRKLDRASEQHEPQQQHQMNARPWLAIPVREQFPTSWPVVQQALTLAWAAHAWPLQAMTRAHWQSIRKLWQTDPTCCDDHAECGAGAGITPLELSLQLPHRIEVRRTGTWMIARSLSDRLRVNVRINP